MIGVTSFSEAGCWPRQFCKSPFLFSNWHHRQISSHSFNLYIRSWALILTLYSLIERIGCMILRSLEGFIMEVITSILKPLFSFIWTSSDFETGFDGVIRPGYEDPKDSAFSWVCSWVPLNRSLGIWPKFDSGIIWVLTWVPRFLTLMVGPLKLDSGITWVLVWDLRSLALDMDPKFDSGIIWVLAGIDCEVIGWSKPCPDLVSRPSYSLADGKS